MANDIDLRYPIGKEEQQPEFASNFDEQLKQKLINDIRHLPSHLEFAIQNLDAAQFETSYRPGGWTIKQLIHHIADSHINAYTRFKCGLTEINPTIKPYDQEAWAKLPDTQNLPVNVSLTLLHALHLRWTNLMENMTGSDWLRTVYHPERKIKLSLWDLLISYSWHCRHHTAHITHARERMNWR